MTIPQLTEKLRDIQRRKHPSEGGSATAAREAVAAVKASDLPEHVKDRILAEAHKTVNPSGWYVQCSGIPVMLKELDAYLPKPEAA